MCSQIQNHAVKTYAVWLHNRPTAKKEAMLNLRLHFDQKSIFGGVWVPAESLQIMTSAPRVEILKSFLNIWNYSCFMAVTVKIERSPLLGSSQYPMK